MLLPADRLGTSIFGENELPELNVTGTERARAREQIILPHSLESVVESVLEAGPSILKIVVPGH